MAAPLQPELPPLPSHMLLDGLGCAVHELRVVLPAAVVQSRRAAGLDTFAPSLLGVDPPLPHGLASRYGGCWRFRVQASTSMRESTCMVQYRCTLPWLPVELIVLLHSTSADGDCKDVNVLGLKVDTLMRRVTERVTLTNDPKGGDCGTGLSTVYCGVVVRVVPRSGLLCALAWPAVPMLQRYLEGPTREVTFRLLRRHWQGIIKQWLKAMLDAKPSEDSAGIPPSLLSPHAAAAATTAAHGSSATAAAVGSVQPPSPMVPARSANSSLNMPSPMAPPYAVRRQSSDFDGEKLAAILAEQDWHDDSPRASTVCETMNQPALNKGIPFYNGFLYKLGDGLLNTTWNLRYFLLIGQSLQYYRSQHEAKPRDVVNLCGANVEWVKDQSRPFSFVVYKAGQRTICLSGSTEKDAIGWVERIEAACRLTVDSGGTMTTPLGGGSRRLLPSPSCFGGMVGEGGELGGTPDVEAQLSACAVALSQAISGDGFRLCQTSDGLRATTRCTHSRAGAAGGPLSGMLSAIVAVLAFVIATSLTLLARLPMLRLIEDGFSAVALVLPCACAFAAAMAAFSLRFLVVSRADPVPVVCATTRIECVNEDLREVLSDPGLYAEWLPDNLEGRLLSLVPGKDEVVFTRFYLGLLGLAARVRSRQRWTRGTAGARLLCSVADVEGDGGGMSGFEGFAVISCEEKADSACMVVWLCALDLAPWAPWFVRHALALRRVRSLLGLREWLASPAGRKHVSSVRKARLESPDAMLRMEPSQSAMLLQGFRRATAGGLCRPCDLERAAAAAQIAFAVAWQAVCGGKEVALCASPAGFQMPGSSTSASSALDSSRPDLSLRYAARWAYASVFLPPAGSTEKSRERILYVVAFLVAGLHLAAISCPHLPWVVWPQGANQHTAVLSEDCHMCVEVADTSESASTASGRGNVWRPPAASPGTRRAFCEMLCKREGFRVSGHDEVVCRTEAPGVFRFVDRGVTTVEFLREGQVAREMVRFTAPELCVRPSGWRFGMGSTYEWQGSAHVIDEVGGVQCDLSFGANAGRPDADAVVGTLRGVQGMDIGKIRGSWLGPLTCDGEVLWRGPKHQPVPF